ncbi:MAG: sugar phosphate isomerase/epimerase family protein [Nitrososphaerota archaeon]|nr:sugar phosphate isomerase/epimerase [Candidatus Bathyarchaeota archaeon]MDW8061549.1 sugar phosphate isomerase/epimerase family protein [Nitrososphaerota archaeon]
MESVATGMEVSETYVIAASTHNIKRPILDWLRLLIHFGFSYLDVECVRSPDEADSIADSRISLEEAKIIENAVEKGVVNVVSIEAGSLFVDTPRLARRYEEVVKKMLKLAKRLKAGIVSFTPASMSGGTSWEGLVESCKSICSEAESYGLIVAFENGEVGSRKIIQSVEDMRRLLDEVDRDNLGLCIDISAAATYDFDVAKIIKSIVDAVKIVHINDITADLAFKNLPVGVGDLDYESIASILSGIKTPMILELYSGYGPVELYLCKRKLEQLLSKAVRTRWDTRLKGSG